MGGGSVGQRSHRRAGRAQPGSGRPHEPMDDLPVQLLSHARLEPPVAKSVLASIAPVLADATHTGGVLASAGSRRATCRGSRIGHDLRRALDACRRSGPGPLAIKTFRELPLDVPPPPTMRVADQSHVHFKLVDRRVWHEGLQFGLPLKKPGSGSTSNPAAPWGSTTSSRSEVRAADSSRPATGSAADCGVGGQADFARRGRGARRPADQVRRQHS